MRIEIVAVGTRGDVEPHAALCLGLRRAGYDARLCAPDDFRAAYGEHLVPFDPIPVSFRDLYGTDAGRELVASGPNGIQFLWRLRGIAAKVAPQAAAAIRDACRDADAVCYSPLGIPARYFAQQQRIPSVATSLQPLGRTGERASPLLPLPRWTPSVVNRLTYRLVEQVFWQSIRPALRSQIASLHRVRDHPGQIYRQPSPALFAYSDLVVPRPADWKPWMHATGYWTLPSNGWQPPDGLAEFLGAGRAVCIGFGSMRSRRIDRIVEMAIEAVNRRGRRAVLLTGWSGYQGLSEGDHGGVYVTAGAPHEWLFPRVSAVIHHGGAGTAAAALRAGVPSVIVPFFFDQDFWARSLASSGLGPPPIAFHRLSADGLGEALDICENCAAARARLQTLGAKLRQEDGVARAVSIIGEALDKGGR